MSETCLSGCVRYWNYITDWKQGKQNEVYSLEIPLK